MPKYLPLWQSAVSGNPDWKAIFKGYRSAVDWPTATYYRELHAAYPEAKFVLTTRSPESWADSFGETINALINRKAEAPAPMREWLEMAERSIEQAGFTIGSSSKQLGRDFEKHTESVKETIPEAQLLIFDVREGWEPLCNFLDLEIPASAFPRSNNREEFWEKVKPSTEDGK